MDEESLPTTWWDDSKYASANYGAAELKDIFRDKNFDFAKSKYLVEDSLRTCHLPNDSSLVIDFFGGSGTTAHAVINLNREDGGKRKYILVEMGEYFDTVLKPRIQKVVYSKDWKDGKPVSREGISHMFKYMRLESYDDTLDNLVASRTEGQQATLEKMHKQAREEYTLSYMLDIETKASDSLLNIDRFVDPSNYTLKIRKDNEIKDSTVDLVETFNYLIGLYVEQTRPSVALRWFAASYAPAKRRSLSGATPKKRPTKTWTSFSKNRNTTRRILNLTLSSLMATILLKTLKSPRTNGRSA